MNKNTIIILGFPGIGKTRFSQTTTLDVADSDSSMFSWVDDTKTQRHPDWPVNYKSHISELIGNKDIIFVSTHHEVREMLRSDKALERRCFTVLPEADRYVEFMRNYEERGNDVRFIALMQDKWECFRSDALKHGVGRCVLLPYGRYIDDELISRLSTYEKKTQHQDKLSLRKNGKH